MKAMECKCVIYFSKIRTMSPVNAKVQLGIILPSVTEVIFP
jgi:hypothetical protein